MMHQLLHDFYEILDELDKRYEHATSAETRALASQLLVAKYLKDVKDRLSMGITVRIAGSR